MMDDFGGRSCKNHEDFPEERRKGGGERGMGKVWDRDRSVWHSVIFQTLENFIPNWLFKFDLTLRFAC